MDRSKRKLLRPLALVCVSAGVFACAEVAVRLRGHRPAAPPHQAIVAIDPGPLLEGDPLLGWRNAPGTHLVTYGSGYEYSVSHTHSGTRITRDPFQEHRYRGLPRLEIYGCSFAYGWSVSDSETFPWHVQAALPDRDVVNLGVGGHGTLQTWLRLDARLEQAPLPALVVVTYGALHDERNVLTRRFRKAIVPYRNQTHGLSAPRARLVAGQLELAQAPLRYSPPPLASSSALVELCDEAYARWERAGLAEREVAWALLETIRVRCESKGVPLVFAGITNDPSTQAILTRLRELGAHTVDLSVDLSDPENTLLPIDWHPSPHAQRQFAAKLLAYLRSEGLI